jgi:hypothetical protein
VLLLLSLSAVCFSQAPVLIGNADFDSGTVVGSVLVPTVWSMLSGGVGLYEFACDTDDKVSGTASGRLTPTEDMPTNCCHVDQRLDSALLGARVRVRAAIKASSNLMNNAQLVIQVGDTRDGGWRQEQWALVSGFQSTVWQQIEKEVNISDNGNRVVFTIYMKPNQSLGTTIWVDALEITNLSVGVDCRPSVLAANPPDERPVAVYCVDGRRVPTSMQVGHHGTDVLATRLYLARDVSGTCARKSLW